MSELVSILLSLRPLPRPLPNDQAKDNLWWGRAVHDFLLGAIQQLDPALAQTLHNQEGLHPFTVSTLLGKFSTGSSLQLDQIYALRLTAYTSKASQALLNALQPGAPLAVGQTVEIDAMPFELLGERNTPLPFDDWQAQTSYAELGGPYLLADRTPPRRIRLQFASPTTFKSEGQHQPLPLPKWVFGNLLERWNAFAPIGFPPELHLYVEECLTLRSYDLRTRAIPIKDNLLRVGMVGWAEFSTLNYDRYWMSLVATLARFALFCGVGAGVSYGLGQCRWINEE